MKKVLATVLAVSMLTSVFVGCSSNSNKNGNDTNNSDGDKVVKVFQLKVEINDALQQLAKKYEEETGVKVEVTSVGGGADYGAALKAEFQKGSEPDIFMIQGAGDLEVWSHKVDDLSSEKWVSNAVKGTLDTVTKDGKIYGMPVATEGYGLIYNKEILDKASIDPKSIDTFDKLKAAVEKLDANKADLGLDNVISYSTKEFWVTGNHTFNIGLAAQDNPAQFTKDYIDGKSDIVNNQGFKDWMNLVDLLCKYGGGATLDTIDYSTQVGNFALGKTAFLHQGNWVSGDLAGLGADFDMGFIPLAINNDTKISGSIPIGVPMYWTVNKDSAANSEAKAFLDWMVNSESGQKALVEDMNMIPAFTNFKVETGDKLAKSIIEYNNAGKTLPWAFTNLPDGFNKEKLAPIFSKYAKGEIDKTAMLEEIQAATKK
ncbi:ABC transporter substrate-binding protein [uncultured Clostridium sp.]|uniref:ABC transporter substrate-binding protein n=1 Tax=uncultured Clostridium sp. TaxID=59620 RepID=UPI00258F9721|nr:ABC transporter substrate-binding protein [uncultured Clostridium sp.]